MITLRKIDAECLQQRQRLGVFDKLGDGDLAKPLGHIGQRLDEQLVVGTCRKVLMKAPS